MKALLQYRASSRAISLLKSGAPPWLDVSVIDPFNREEYFSELASTEVLLHVLDPITSEVLNAAPKLKLVQKIGIGVNTIDLAGARSRGVLVANMPGTNSQAVAEHTLALMLAALRRLTFLDGATRDGHGWELSAEALDNAGEICGRTIGFVGYGAVPRRLSPALRALGAKVCYFSDRDGEDADAIRMDSLEALLRTVDIVSLHIPLTSETRGCLNGRTFAWMKPGAFLVNTARGELIDEHALYEALTKGTLSGAASDVFDSEPLSHGNPLLQLPNFTATPHIAWLTQETLQRSFSVAVENCRRLRDNQELLHIV